MNGPDHPVELFSLRDELLATGGRERVVTRAPIVVGRAPFALDVAVEHQTLERRIEGAFANLEYITGNEPEMLGNAVAVHLASRHDPQNEQIEGAGKKLRSLRLSHEKAG